MGVLVNLNGVKGPGVLLEAAVRVIAYEPKAKFVLIGTGPLRQELEARAGALSLRDRVLFLGARQDVPNLLIRMEMLVAPSFAEGFSNAVLESMAAGLPVVATDVGGNREAIIDGETGFLAPSHDPSALADRILRLLADRSLAKRMGRAGRRRIEAHFTLERMVVETECFYERLLERGKEKSEDGSEAPESQQKGIDPKHRQVFR